MLACLGARPPERFVGRQVLLSGDPEVISLQPHGETE